MNSTSAGADQIERLKASVAGHVATLFTRPSSLKFGERGREWSWRWGYWGRALSKLYCATGDPDLLALFDQTHQGFRAYRDDSLRLRDDLRGRVMKTWGTRLRGQNDKGHRACEVETTGLLLLPYTDLLLRAGDELPENLRAGLIETVRQGLDAHAREFLEHPPSDGGYFVSEWTGGVEPLNHTHLYAAVAAEAFGITGEERYLKIAQQAYAFFRHNWFEEENRTVSWAYAPTPDSSNMMHAPQVFGQPGFDHAVGGELFFKAGVTIELPLAMYRIGLIDRTDLELIAASLRQNVLVGRTTVNMYISPRKILPDRLQKRQTQMIKPEYISMYYRLAPFDPFMEGRLDTLIDARTDWFPDGLKDGSAALFAAAFRAFEPRGRFYHTW
ncbi:hypothetical protein OS189_17650 [Sulfitobacter sp. F26169L]|uniref:hypothetical protein n=1 Tax=Sulfitobacter sp. F26169L TaxID=2996015 RepID=UPI002260BB45|nr:hypothetical protein [Sulfitobacter sp. F26169L]MCX7568170.1 hypothetical protein [Sulfitobacter sp. F26169L]